MADRVNLFQRLLHAVLRSRPNSSESAAARHPPPTIPTSSPVLLLVEGRNDSEFLRRASAILHVADESLPDLGDLERRGHITFVPLGGGDLLGWTYRLAGMGRAEFHLLCGALHNRCYVADSVMWRPADSLVKQVITAKLDAT